MKAPPFVYHRPDTLEGALALLAEHGDDAKVLAGGQSLIPLMALRMGRPAHVVDLAAIEALDRITVADDGAVTIGAMVRHAAAERSPVVAERAPLVHRAMPWIAHRAIRSRGTVVGSIAHADPAAEMPAVVLAADATLTAASAAGERQIAGAQLFEGYLQTSVRADEIVTQVTFPAWPEEAVGAVEEEARRHGDYALAGVVAKLVISGDTIAEAAIACFGVASTAVRMPHAEEALAGSTVGPEAFAAAGAIVSEHLSPPGDVHGTSAYRRHLAGVLTRRALASATAGEEVAA